MRSHFLFLFSFLFIVTTQANAQVFYGNLTLGKHSLAMHNSVFLAGLNYNRRLPIKLIQRDLNLQAEISTPIFLLKDFDSWNIEISAGVLFRNDQVWNTGIYLAQSLATADNILGTHFSTSSSITLQPGYYRNNWFLAADLRLQITEFTYIKFSQRHHDFYADIANTQAPDSALLSMPNTRLLLGFIYGRTNKTKTWSFMTSGGLLSTNQAQSISIFPEVGLMPFYFSVDISRHF